MPSLAVPLTPKAASSFAPSIVLFAGSAARRSRSRGCGAFFADRVRRVERGLHALAERGDAALAADVHEEDVRLVEEEVVVERRHLEAVVEQRAHRRVHLVLEEHEVAHHHRLDAGFSPGVNAAHEVSPMNGGIFQPSTSTVTSPRGNETFTTPSAFSGFAPVAAATAFSSIAGDICVCVDVALGCGDVFDDVVVVAAVPAVGGTLVAFVPPHATHTSAPMTLAARAWVRRFMIVFLSYSAWQIATRLRARPRPRAIYGAPLQLLQRL